MTKLYAAEAKVHKQLGNGSYRVKVSVLGLGLYINGMIVFPPAESKPNWAVYPPSIKVNGSFTQPFEFDKNEPLWIEIFEACTDAVRLDQQSQPRDFAPDDIPDEPIDFSAIPF